MSAEAIDPASYRNAMSRYAGHVQIVTTGFEGEMRGVTVTAACSVSDDPASLLVCVNAGNASNAIFARSGAFALNTLAAHHLPLAEAFAGKGGLAAADRFAMARWLGVETGAPVLSDALAGFDCRLVDVRTVATHMILLGEVRAIHLGPPNPALLYHERRFKVL